MLPPTPQLLVSTATALVAREHHRRARRADDRIARADKTRGDASLRFVHFAGFWSHFTQSAGTSSWPLPPSTALEELAKFAEKAGAFTARPLVGDVFLLASARGEEHVFAGIVSAVETTRTMLNGSTAFVCATIEGELRAARPGDGAPQIASVHLVRRLLAPALGDRFIRWWDLPGHELGWEAIRREALAYGLPKNLFTIPRESQAA